MEVATVYTKQCKVRKYSYIFSAESYKHRILARMIMVCMFVCKKTRYCTAFVNSFKDYAPE